MKSWCQKLGYFVAIGGTLGSTASAYLYGTKTEVSGTYVEFVRTTRDWPLTITIFFASMLSVVILATILFAISIILERLDEIDYYESNDNEGHILDKVASDDNYWTCKCGKRNPNYTGTCSCGRSRE